MDIIGIKFSFAYQDIQSNDMEIHQGSPKTTNVSGYLDRTNDEQYTSSKIRGVYKDSAEKQKKYSQLLL